jgi:ferrous iron transport protein B
MRENSVIVLAGNPNVGKSTLFNHLTGSRQKIANYPGVTVEKFIGFTRTPAGRDIEIIDLPGTYSLNTKTEDESIAVRHIRGDTPGGPKPDGVIVMVEASKLARSLLLFFQIRAIHNRIILAINMMDELPKNHLSLNLPLLSELLATPVVGLSARSGDGIPDLLRTIDAVFLVPENKNSSSSISEPKHNVDTQFGQIDAIVKKVLTRQNGERKNLTSEKFDKILLHRFWGPVVFFAVMLLLFQALFSGSAPAMDFIDSSLSTLGDWAKAQIPLPWLASLISDGVIAGVGSVLVFVPQIAVTFILIGFLEMSGYLARGAFLIDRLMRAVGLEGRAFIPLISSFACAIPGILAARTMSNPRQRLITTLVAPLITCSARLPVYTLLIASFVPAAYHWGPFQMQGLVLFSLFLMGLVFAMFMSLIFNRFLPNPCQSSFLMELPRYRLPTAKNLYTYVSFRTLTFVKNAGTVIFVLSILLWILAYFPRSQKVLKTYEEKRMAVKTVTLMAEKPEEALAKIDHEEAGELLRHSYMGQLGHFIEPVLQPMGFDWRLGIGIISAFAAREVFVSTLGIVFNLGEADEESQSLRALLQSAKNPDGTTAYTLRTALSLLIFFALACQCMSTLAVIKRETNSLKWPAFVFLYMTVLAFVMSTVAYQGLGLLGWA